MAEQSRGAPAVGAQRLKNIEEGIKDQMAVLEKAEKELASFERGLTEELRGSLNDVRKRFMLLKQSIGEKEAHCCLKIREAAEKRMKIINSWRAKRSESSALATDVSTCIHVHVLYVQWNLIRTL